MKDMKARNLLHLRNKQKNEKNKQTKIPQTKTNQTKNE